MRENEPDVPLGRTGMRVAPLGIGTWAWGDCQTWGFGKTHAESDLLAAFETGMAEGIDFFDTAEVYGNGQSERFLGRFIKSAKLPVVVATKFMPFPWRVRRRDFQSALRRSLDRLAVDQVDLYQIHWPFPPRSTGTWVEELGRAVRAGLVRSAGVSNYTTRQTRRAHELLARHGIPLASNQVSYSLLHRAPERNGLMEACRELGITLIAYSPLAMGVLSGKYTSKNPPKGLLRRPQFSRGYLDRIQPLIALLGDIGRTHGGKTPAQVALNWVLSKGAVPIPGAKNGLQAKENAGALGWKLASEEVAALDAAADRGTNK